MNIHNINLQQIIYSVYLKIHLFSLIDMHVLHLYIIQYFQCWFKNKETRKPNTEKQDVDFWPKRGHIQILQTSTFTLCTVPNNLLKMLPSVLHLLAQFHTILIHPKILRYLVAATVYPN